MDKFEYQAKLEEINRLVETGNYEEAAQIADSIEWKRVRSVRTLCTVSEIYEEVGRVEDSKAILSRAYRRSPNSRQILYRLTEVCVLTQEFDDAVEYYTEYVNLSPNDSNRYVLKYEIYKGRGSSIEEQIKVLEDLKKAEYTEQWAYELASLYDQAGMADKCVSECNDLALWFHSGKYVVKALELKQKYEPLTREQQTIYDNPSEIVDMETKEAVIEKAVPTLDEEIVKDLPSSEAEAIADSILMDTEKEIAAAVSEHKANEEAKLEEVSLDESENVTESTIDSQDGITEEQNDTSVGVQEDHKETNKTEKKDLKKFDTINLQKELANSMRQILSGIKPGKKAGSDKTEEELELEEILKLPEGFEDDEITENNKDKEDPSEVVTEGDVLSAATINLGAKLKKDIGENSLREYAAAKAKEREEKKLAETQRKTEIKLPVLETIDIAETEESEEEENLTIKTPILEVPETPVMKKVPEIKEVKLENIKLEGKETDNNEKIIEELPDIEEIPEVPEVPDAVEELLENEEEITEEKDMNGTVAEAEKDAVVVTKNEETEKQAMDPMSYTRSGLDAKEKEMLGFWSTIRGINEQVDATVAQIMRSSLSNRTSTSGNVVLVGDAGNGRTTLAIAIAKIVCRCKGQQKTKVAKIYAEDLNNKDIAQVVSKVAGGALIIEEAGDMSDGTIAQLSMAMEFKTDSLVVFLEDERRYLQELLARNPKFAQKFDITVNVPMLTNDELVEFGKMYAIQNDCVLSDNAIMALYDNIGAMQTPEQPVAILDVKELLDKAIKRAKTFGIGKVFSTISGKRYNSDNRIIVKANAFKKIK